MVLACRSTSDDSLANSTKTIHTGYTPFPPPKRNIPANSARFFPPYSLHPHSSSSISPHYPNYQNVGPTRHTLTLFSPPPPLLSLPFSFFSPDLAHSARPATFPGGPMAAQPGEVGHGRIPPLLHPSLAGMDESATTRAPRHRGGAAVGRRMRAAAAYRFGAGEAPLARAQGPRRPASLPSAPPRWLRPTDESRLWRRR
jgi:hypothetical protein